MVYASLMLNKISAYLRSFSPGFTMIELLIVISILGILAVAVLSAINPVEQINRGRDTGSRSDAEQLLSAIDRYNAFQGYFPWTIGEGDTTDNVAWGAATSTDPTLEDDNGCHTFDKLSDGNTAVANCNGTDELKLSFIDRVSSATYNSLFIYNDGVTGSSTYVCFRPRSKAFLTEARTRCGNGLPTDLQGAVDDVCAAGNYATSEDVYVCLP